MTNTATETRSVVIEREIAYPPEKIWRALTQPHLIEEWLMKNDFKPVVGHRFNLRGDWGGVLDCEVLAIEPNRTLSYTWNFAHDDAAYNLKSVVTFTLTPTSKGTHLAWSRQASGRSRSRHSAAPRRGGSSSLRSWSRSWRGKTEVCRCNSKLGLRYRRRGLGVLDGGEDCACKLRQRWVARPHD